MQILSNLQILRTKRAFLSIDESAVTVLTDTDSVEKVPHLQLLDFLKEKKVKEVVISQFFPNLISLRVNLPQIAKPQKKKKVVRALISSEIRKRYFPRGQFTYSYQIIQTDAGHFARCYVVDNESLSYFDHLVSAGIEVKGLFPSFMIVLALLKDSKVNLEGVYSVCLFMGNLRHVFVFSGEELIVERAYESDSNDLSDLDIDNIQMTMNYALQNLRVKPDRVIFVGFRKQIIEGLNLEYEFVEIDSSQRESIICHSLKRYYGKIKDKSLTPEDHRDFIEKRNLLRMATFALTVASFVFLTLSAIKASRIWNNLGNIKAEKAQIAAKAHDFQALLERINHFEQKILPILNLQNIRNSETPIRLILNPLADASLTKGVHFTSIHVENTNPTKIRVTGKILVPSLSDRNIVFGELKQRVESSGFKITNQQFDFKAEDFTLELLYEQGKVL